MEAARTAFVTGGSGFIGGELVRRLVGDGWRVRALARSEASADRVRAAGAEPASGSLEDVEALEQAARGADTAFHAAAHLGEWGRREDFERGNVEGTRHVIAACRGAGVRRLVHVGTEAAILAGQPLVNVNEDAPLRPDSKSDYCATKAMAEQAVRDANGDGLDTVVVRPRFVWGRGDATILPRLVDMAKKGRLQWIDGGRHRTSTTHVLNVVEGLVRGAERGRAGGVYFVTDGEPVEFRAFVTDLLATQGVEAPDKTAPGWAARLAPAPLETIWRALGRESPPPVTRMAVWVSSLECTIDISRARTELGYEPVVSLSDGLEELRRDAA